MKAGLTFRERFFRAGRRYAADERGAAAVEFALILTLLTISLLNVIDVATYAWNRIQLENAAQAAAQAAWATCNTNTNLPATPSSYAKCLALPAAITAAVQSTSLGTRVTATTISENYYCLNTSTNVLVTVGTFPGTKPADCSSVDSTSTIKPPPGDYILITASYTYTPLFSAVSVASLLTTPIVRTAWMRLG